MLILKRRQGEQIVIGEGDSQAIITVIGSDRDGTRIGIEADKERVPVHRKEIYDRINRRARQFNR